MSSDRRSYPGHGTLLGLFLGLCLLPIHQTSAAVLPSGLVCLASGDPIILDLQRGLFRLSTKQGSAQRWTDFGALDAVDITTVPRSDEIFLATYSTGEGRTRLFQLNASGRRRLEWDLPARYGLLAGVVLSRGGETAYLSSARTSEIYQLDLDTTRSVPRLVTTVPGAATLTAIALDVKRQQLFVADPVNAAIYTLPVAGGRAVKVLVKVGEPVALAVDSVTDRLFVADRRAGKIWVVALDRMPTAVRLFAAPTELLELAGLAVDANGRVWVGDHKSGKVFLFSKDGQLIRTYTP
jgi:DNA-binding beta-propeller fold protein YncE